MANAAKLLRQMRGNPCDWRIEDLRLVAEWNGFDVAQGKGSHVKFSHSASQTVLTIPMRRPIKPIYVKLLVRLIDEFTGTA